MSLDGITAVVTGAAHGIGAATAQRLAADGAFVVVADIDSAGAHLVVDRIQAAGGQSLARELDVAESAQWNALRDSLTASGRVVGVVVNNAFSLVRRSAHETSEEEWNRQIAVDLSSVYHSVRAFIPDLIASSGCMVNVSSVHAIRTLANHPAYAAAKGGVLALTRQLALEYGPAVRINAVLPGPILTRTWDGVGDDVQLSAARGTALGRLGNPEEVAAAIAFLASAESSYITGAELLVDGGQSARINGG